MRSGLFLAFLVGCGPSAPEAPECDLALDTLEGRSFVMLETLPGGGEVENPVARVKFEQGEAGLQAKYTVASLSDVYTYDCEDRSDEDKVELFCAEEIRAKDWCQALLVGDAECSKKKLRALGAEGIDNDTLNTEIRAAKENYKKYKNTDSWAQFQLNNNNLANKLQGRLYVGIDEKRCRLKVGDFYWTIYNGRGIEDSNPVGQNPFVPSDEEWMFEHCNNGSVLPGIPTETLPDDLSTISRRREFAKGQDIWFHYVGDQAVKAEEGCSYSYDAWAQWKPVAQGVAVTPGAKGELEWKVKHSYDAPIRMVGFAKDIAVMSMVRNKTCDGKTEKIDVVCDAASFSAAPPAADAAGE